MNPWTRTGWAFAVLAIGIAAQSAVAQDTLKIASTANAQPVRVQGFIEASS